MASTAGRLSFLVFSSRQLASMAEASLSPQTAAEIPPAITTPDKVETRIGPLDFKDGMPSKETIAKVYDNLDFTHALRGVREHLAGGQHTTLSTRAF